MPAVSTRNGEDSHLGTTLTGAALKVLLAEDREFRILKDDEVRSRVEPADH